MFSIARAASAPEAFDAWRMDRGFVAIEAHPLYGAFGRRYYPAVFGNALRNECFAVLDGERVVLLATCTAGNRELNYFGMPIRLFPRADLEPKIVAAAIEAAFAHIDALQTSNDARSVIVADDTSLGTLSSTGKQCLNRGYRADVRLTGLVSLDGGEAGLRRGLRKRFHSMVNWGRRNLEISVVDARNPDRDLFRRYQNFHRQIAGRTTRPQDSWDTMFEWIAAGRGELVLGSLGGELNAGTMVVDGLTISYYASGVYNRERFDKPLGHWPLWLAMLHSAERGLRLFELGDLPLADAGSAKEVGIGYFKRGFAATIATWIAWTWKVDAPQPGSAP